MVHRPLTSALVVKVGETDTVQEELVSASLYFLRALGNAYGSGPAMDTWERLADAVDPDLKGAIFAAMLNGGQSGHITVSSYTGSNIVGIIKAIRTHDIRNLGLKEAKEMYVALRDYGRAIKLQVKPGRAEEIRQELRSYGCTVV